MENQEGGLWNNDSALIFFTNIIFKVVSKFLKLLLKGECVHIYIYMHMCVYSLY